MKPRCINGYVFNRYTANWLLSAKSSKHIECSTQWFERSETARHTRPQVDLLRNESTPLSHIPRALKLQYPENNYE